MLRGALAAAVTPLRDERLDVAAVAPYVGFLAGHGLDGVLVLGTTGEGVLFSPEERYIYEGELERFEGVPVEA